MSGSKNFEIIDGRVPLDDMTGWHDELRKKYKQKRFSEQEWESFFTFHLVKSIEKYYSEGMSQSKCYDEIKRQFIKDTGKSPADEGYEEHLKIFIESVYNKLAGLS